jgi:hypothetical protein
LQLWKDRTIRHAHVDLRAEKPEAAMISSTADSSASVRPVEGENSTASDQSLRIDLAVGALDAWFDTMRGPDGYGGPVSHWWQQCFMYTGAGLDWRYEGIIIGYLNLWRSTGQREWLEKAIRAGRDIVAGQNHDGSFSYSGFEMNPGRNGTPHEAACDLALLMLARELREAGDEAWALYADVAKQNLQDFYIARLWDVHFSQIGDSMSGSSFVPNKAATASEALIALSWLTGEDTYIERYVLPTLDSILQLQVRDGSACNGAICQNSFGTNHVEKYFPLYISRCVPGLLQGYRVSGREKYLDAAVSAMAFVIRNINEDGSIPTVIYPNGRTSPGPSWISPLGDVLRASELVAEYEHTAQTSRILDRLLNGQDETGGIQTASDFALQSVGNAPSLPDVRDLLHVAGWCDKAFRYLTTHVSGGPVPIQPIGEFERECQLQGKRFVTRESSERLEITANGTTGYLWIKGEPHPRQATREFWLR